MTALTAHLLALHTFLLSVHPELGATLLVAVIWCTQWLVRRYRPAWWLVVFGWIPADAPALIATTLQSLPSVAVGAGLTAGLAGEDVPHAMLGAVLGASAVVVHHVLKAIPQRFVAYTGALGAGVRRDAADGP